MPTVNLTKENFSQTIQDSKIILIDFWADWCGPCKRFAPIFDEASENHADVVFAKLDTEAEPEIASALDIQAIPTLMALREGYLLFREAGALGSSQLETLLSDIKKVDMEEVRAEVAKQEAEHGHDHDHGHDHEGHSH